MASEVSLTREDALFSADRKKNSERARENIDGLRQIIDHEQGSVVIAGAGSFIRSILSPSMLSLAQAHPRTNVRLAEIPTRQRDPDGALTRRIIR